ncbi:MarR family winged helix-turn-helix transcriptional regulator [Humibacter ginsenosidimutans]|uniref:MarR family transcriptional regulator n=1 Tax=Humibacter ginsenosidimutans TaxID=2599293 RepID=A0A5B8M7L0_9MICO|nr:MarR family transcriptional regulator [Humibacter ginsenosidimutans]QDZ16191.1 MarR family transcriptional regulator [Humibacter ginsenosidimutans]
MLTEPISLPLRDGVDSEAELRFLLGDLAQLSGRVTRLAHRLAGGSEGPATWRTLAVLQTSGPMRLGELAAQSQVAQPTMTKIVAGLVEREWVKRIADADDARAWQIGISAKGIIQLAEWRDGFATALLPLFDDLDADERDTIRRAVDLVRPRITQAYTLPEKTTRKTND